MTSLDNKNGKTNPYKWVLDPLISRLITQFNGFLPTYRGDFTSPHLELVGAAGAHFVNKPWNE